MSRTSRPLHRQTTNCVLIVLAILGVTSPLPLRAAVTRGDLDSLPPGAPGAISAALGRDDSSYHAVAAGGGWRAMNRAHALTVDFSREEVRIGVERDRIALRLHAVGYGESLSPVAAADPIAHTNRVEYRRGSLTEWYINGPLGLEQGFTLDARPGGGAGPVTLALSLSGNLDVVPEAGGLSVALARLGTAALRYRGLLAVDSAGRELPARIEVRKDALLLRVEDAGARYPIVIDPWVQKATLVVDNPEGNDHFGVAVAISGDTIVVGANRPPQPDNTPASAYVFVKPSSGWSGILTETAELNASDEATGDWFGAAVDVSGDVIVVGAQFATVGTTQDQGAAYVFVKPATGWAGLLTENAKLTASDGSASENFGDKVAIDGNTVVVGLSTDDIGGNGNQGSAYVFEKPVTGWAGALTQSAKLIASDGSANDQFGHSVAVTGDTVVAGAFGHNGFKIVIGPGGPVLVPISAVGQVYVFVKPGGGWTGALTENARLRASDGDELDILGISVAASGDDVFAGASGGLFGKEGAAYVFVKPGAGWSGTLFESSKLTASDAAFDDHFGSQVGVAGNTALIGARPTSPAPGKGYLFVKPAAGWSGALTETEKVASSSVAFCCNVAFGGKTIVVGEEDSEQARVFEKSYIILLDLAKLLRRIFNAGSTVPVKFQVTDGAGTGISDAEARRLSSSCSVRIFFSGGDPSPNCASWDGTAFQFDLKTARGLAPGTYAITVKIFVEGVETTTQSVNVQIR